MSGGTKAKDVLTPGASSPGLTYFLFVASLSRKREADRRSVRLTFIKWNGVAFAPLHPHTLLRWP